MAIVSYDVEIMNNTKEIRNIVANTLAVYNSALNYVCDVVYDNLRHKFKRAKKSYRQRLHHWKK